MSDSTRCLVIEDEYQPAAVSAAVSDPVRVGVVAARL